MKTRNLIFIMSLMITLSAFSQRSTLELTFSAEFNDQYTVLDSILIENLTLGGDTTLYPPDTVLMLDNISGINDNIINIENVFSVSQNYPNPFNGSTFFNINLPEREYIVIAAQDVMGRILAQYKGKLSKGNHTFAFYAGTYKYYVLTVSGKQASKSIKMLNNNNLGNQNHSIEHINNTSSYTKSALQGNKFNFFTGNKLKYSGYTSYVTDVRITDVIEDSPTINANYIFKLSINTPCPETPTLTYEGQVYNTVLIGNQCWLKENLNVGTMINTNIVMTDNNILEKYCFDNDTANCEYSGGMYQWDEVMQYVDSSGAQGICPNGWHIPTDEEWEILEGTVDSLYPVGNPEWERAWNYRGYNAGINLKSTAGWYQNTNGPDYYGFSAVPSGFRYPGGYFSYYDGQSYFWTSDSSWARHLSFSSNGIYNSAINNKSGLSVRCLKD